MALPNKTPYFRISKYQERFLREYIRTGDKAAALIAGNYSSAPENVDRNFQYQMDVEKVQWAYQKMLRERERAGVVLEGKTIDKSLLDGNTSMIIDKLEEALSHALAKKSPVATATVLEKMASILGVYQKKKAASEVLSIYITTNYEGTCPRCGFDRQVPVGS